MKTVESAVLLEMTDEFQTAALQLGFQREVVVAQVLLEGQEDAH